ncbi:MAG: hypothetical protein JSW55_14615 [Chloroflexota bacterium]|nr:MAG: hypothetical protein JSW55_14615 [Chloroflexota bacterium]
MFEVGGQYANRNGTYTVIEVNEPKMTVEYADGTTAELNMAIQSRIWENILAEEEIQSSRTARTSRRKAKTANQYFVRPANSLKAEELGVKGWKEHVTVRQAPKVRITLGDRLIYFSIESQTFYAVGTVTGPPSEPTRRDHPPESHAEDPVLLFPLDVDARALNLEKAVSIDSVEFESQPDIKKLLGDLQAYVPISEDEFELLAELLTEASEDEEEVELDEETEEVFDD